MGYGIVHNTLLRNMTRSFHFHIPCIQPGQGGSGTATVERWSGGASRVDTTRLEPKMGKGDEMGTDHFFQGMPWDTTVICDQIIGIPWDIDGYSWYIQLKFFFLQHTSLRRMSPVYVGCYLGDQRSLRRMSPISRSTPVEDSLRFGELLAKSLAGRTSQFPRKDWQGKPSVNHH